MTSKLLNSLMSVAQIAQAFQEALDANEPINHINLGDGEIMFLAYQRIPGFEKFPATPSGLDPYAIYKSDQRIRDEILDGVLHSDIIGMPAALYTGNWPAGQSFLDFYPVPVTRICDSYMGRLLHSSGLLYEILKNRRVYLVGNHSLNLAPFLEERQIEVAGHAKVDFFADIPRVKDCLNQVDFDIAVISAGIPTLILSPWIARTLRRCALDFGCAIHFLNESFRT